MSIEVLSIAPKTPPTRVIILLHGWGANRHDLASLAPLLDRPDDLLLFPEAPFPHPQVPGGKMWYDLSDPSFFGLKESRRELHNWLANLETETQVPLSRTILGGFSQGGAMALDVGLDFPFAGLVSLSGYLHSNPQRPENGFPPIFMAHGIQDPVVPVSAARHAGETLTELGAVVDYIELPMAHEIIPTEIDRLRNFIALY